MNRHLLQLLNLYDEKGRTFYPLRFEINKKADKIKVFDRWQGGRNHQTIYEFYLVDNNWQKFLGNKRGIIPIHNLDTRVKELIRQVNQVTDLNCVSYTNLSDSQKEQIKYHYAKNGDLQDSYRVRYNKPNYSIEASRKMLEDGWDSETVKSIFNTLDKNSEVSEVIHTQKQIPLIIVADNVVAAIDLIHPTFTDRVKEKLEEPEMIESKSVIKPETIEFKPAVEELEIEFKPVSEDLKSVITESDPIIEQEQSIKVAEINQPKRKNTQKKKRDRGGR